MQTSVARLTAIACIFVVGAIVGGCGKKEMLAEPAVGPVTGTGEPAPKADPVLIGETPDCKAYRLTDRISEFSARYVYIVACKSQSAGIAVP